MTTAIRPLRLGLLLLAALAPCLVLAACGGDAQGPVERFAPDSMGAALEDAPAELRRMLSVDADGALRVAVEGPGSLRLFRVGNPPGGGGDPMEDCTVLYRAQLATRGLEGEAYLELLCHFPGRGTYFSRDLGHKLGGDADWTDVTTPFFLEHGQRPAWFDLNLVIEGGGQGDGGAGVVLVRGVRLLEAAGTP